MEMRELLGETEEKSVTRTRSVIDRHVKMCRGVRCCLHFCLRQLSTVEARFSGHRISGKPRFKGHSLQNLRDHF